MPYLEASRLWTFGATQQGANSNSTGSGAAYNSEAFPRENTFFVETSADGTCSYQIRAARTSSGPWSVLSSGTLSSNSLDVWQYTGPFYFFSPRVKTLKSTGDTVFVQYIGN